MSVLPLLLLIEHVFAVLVDATVVKSAPVVVFIIPVAKVSRLFIFVAKQSLLLSAIK